MSRYERNDGEWYQAIGWDNDFGSYFFQHTRVGEDLPEVYLGAKGQPRKIVDVMELEDEVRKHAGQIVQNGLLHQLRIDKDAPKGTPPNGAELGDWVCRSWEMGREDKATDSLTSRVFAYEQLHPAFVKHSVFATPGPNSHGFILGREGLKYYMFVHFSEDGSTKPHEYWFEIGNPAAYIKWVNEVVARRYDIPEYIIPNSWNEWGFEFGVADLRDDEPMPTGGVVGLIDVKGGEKSPSAPVKKRDERPVCDECRSENITVDASVEWDAENGKWEVSTVYDKHAAYCSHCGSAGEWEWANHSGVRNGLCPVCGHYGEDCTGWKEYADDGDDLEDESIFCPDCGWEASGPRSDAGTVCSSCGRGVIQRKADWPDAEGGAK